MVSIKSLNKADVLAALHNAARPQGKGFLVSGSKPMNRLEAQRILDQGSTYFDYLQGRVMKVDLSTDEFDPWGFDRDNGQGAAQTAITALRGSGNTNPEAVKEIHRKGTLAAADDAKKLMEEPTTASGAVVHLGLREDANRLRSKVDHAVKKVS